MRPFDFGVEGQPTAEWYDQWHAQLEERTQTAMSPRRGVLVSELLGPDDGPYDDRWKPVETG